MKLSEEEIRHIAHLGRIKVSEAEIEKYRGEMNDILDYVGQLQEVDTSKVEPTARVTDSVNVFRDDKVIESEVSQSDLLANVPDKHDDYVKVKAVLE